MKLNPLVSATVIVLCLLCPRLVSAQDAPVNKDGKILGTGGVSSVSGAGGGGLIPWATLSSYADAGQRGGSLFRTRVDVDAYQLDIDGGALTFGNRMELSFARQNLLVKPANLHVRQDKTGIKVRVLGDIIFDKAPQITLGAERGSLRDKGLARAVGAQHTSGTDYTISFAKAWLNGIARRTTLLNVNVRYGNANQFGLLGYGGDDQDVKWTAEFAAAVFLTRQLVVGMEYRQKPDNLGALREDNAHDLFLAYFPDKRVSLTAAWVDLGEIAGARNQQGMYLSAQITF
ncbi:DUF3034 family protein [Gammaproteobacteria bacterium LSUCC0112]|nr:DUF3034 family protein [Gammaproteobacteria bacterium LSUCC0112]